DDITEYEWRRSVHQVADGRVEVGVFLEFLREIHDAVFAEGRDRLTVLRVEGDQLVAWSNGHDARLLAVGPVGNSAAVLANAVGAGALVEAPGPDRFTGAGICGNNGAAIARGEIQCAV